MMRANLDGSNIETLVDTSQGDPRPGPDATKWCVGVAIDVDGGKVYWTQKGPDNGAGRRSVDELAREENEVIIGLLRLRANGASALLAEKKPDRTGAMI